MNRVHAAAVKSINIAMEINKKKQELIKKCIKIIIDKLILLN